MFITVIMIDMSDSCHLRGRSIRFDENPKSDPMLLGLPKFILYAHLISHLIVCCSAERNQVLHSHHYHHRCHCCYCCCCYCHYTLRQWFQADVSVKSRVSKIHLCLAFHTNSREFSRRFWRNKIYYSIRSRSISCNNFKKSPNRARNLHHSNLWQGSSSPRERYSFHSV